MNFKVRRKKTDEKIDLFTAAPFIGAAGIHDNNNPYVMVKEPHYKDDLITA